MINNKNTNNEYSTLINKELDNYLNYDDSNKVINGSESYDNINQFINNKSSKLVNDKERDINSEKLRTKSNRTIIKCNTKFNHDYTNTNQNTSDISENSSKQSRTRTQTGSNVSVDDNSTTIGNSWEYDEKLLYNKSIFELEELVEKYKNDKIKMYQICKVLMHIRSTTNNKNINNNKTSITNKLSNKMNDIYVNTNVLQ